MDASPAPSPKANRLVAGLYLVATPIGNLRDITLRALDILGGVDIILCEDTRVAGKLLAAHGLKGKLERYDEHSAERARPKVLRALAQGGKLALISDAGTPLISDPGYRLVREAVAQGSAVFPVPGPSAALAALVVSGLPTDRFLFAGFPPPKSAARRTMFAELAPVRATLIFYEGGPRLRASLVDMAREFGAREAAVAREVTKLHETVIRGPLADLAEDDRLDAPKGEIVVLVAPGSETVATPEETDAALAEAVTRLGPSRGASEVAKALGLSRRELYARALTLRGDGE
jgi:16S rRNA (cytidine1402-2'-O)-methyltransferase